MQSFESRRPSRPVHLQCVTYQGRSKTARHREVSDGRNRTNVWDCASVNSFKGSRREDLSLHPTVKPSALVADAIQDVTRRGDLVLDLFLGSGTTLVAAERVGRRFLGMDIDPAYVDVAIDRWTNMTSGIPERAENKA
jgi:DNA modification methylase